MSLHETVVDHIDLVGLFAVEGADLLGSNTSLLVVRAGWLLGDIGGEHLFWPVYVFAEVEVVNFFSVATIAVTASDQVEHLVARGHDVQVLHHAQELLRGNVLRLGSIKVSEAWLEEDPVGDNVNVEGCHHFDHLILITVTEHSGCSGVSDNISGVHCFREDLVKLGNKFSVVDKTWLCLALVAIDKLTCLCLCKSDSKSADACAECSLSDSALAELVEVDEELLDTDSVLGDASLDTLFNIGFMTKDSGLSLVIALMTVSRGADVLSVITD